MKKSILIFCTVLTILSLTACDFNNKNDLETNQPESLVSEEMASNTQVMEKVEKRIFSDFIYDIGPRFNVIKKGDLDNVRSFSDFIGEEHAQRIVSYKSLSVIILDGEKQTDTKIKGTGKDGVLTAAQIKLLQSADYSTNLLIWADYKEKNIETGQLEDSHWTPYLTIVPEKQANYASGKDELIEYLKNNSEEVRANVDAEKLQPAKLFFTVTKNGTIENVNLDRPSGYPNVDETMKELITETQGAWKPAENSKGEKVDQELVISFGLMGC